MDLPQYLHHHPRYATSSSSPSEQQQQQPNYPNYPHRNYHHHHRTSPPQNNPPQLRPSLPLPLPPPPQSQSPPALYKTLPLPPPPLPQRTFSPRSIDSDHHPRTFSPRVNHHRPQPPPDSDRPRHRLSQQFVDHHYHHRDRSRNNYSPRRDYDSLDSHKPYRRDDGGVRFRFDYDEQRDHHHRRAEESYPPHRRSSNHHETTSFRGDVVEFQSSPNNMSSGGVYDESAYEELLRSGRRYENYEIQRWGLERPEVVAEEAEEEEDDLYDPFELDEREAEDYYESSSGRRVTASRWKQIQKKSALLRLQNPKLHDRSHSAYFDSPGPSGVLFRGKEQQYEYSGHGRDELLDQQRRDGGGGGGGASAGSPLDLDVSFNGNSLVAKTVRTRECSGLPHTKLTENVVNLDSSPQKEAVRLQGEGSSSGMNVQLSSVVTDAAFVVKSEVERPPPPPKGKSLQKDDMNSKLCSVVTADAFVKSEVERTSKGKTLPKNGKCVGSGGQKSSLNLPKKMKVVKKTVAKKIVKKVMKPTLQMKSKIDEAGTSSAHSSIAGTGKVVASPISEPCRNGLPVSKKVDYVSDENNTVLNSCNENIGDDSTANMGSSSPEAINVDQIGPLNADTPVKGLLTISNANSNVSDTVRVAPCHEIGDVVDVSKSFCQSGDNSSVENDVREEKSQAISPVESNLSFGTLNSGKMQEHMIVKGSDHGVETTLDLDNDLTLSHPNIMVHDVGTVDAINEQPSRYQLPISVQNVGELPMAISAAESNSVGLSNSGETKAVHTRIDRRSRWDSDEVYVIRDKSISVSNDGNANSLGKQPYSNCASKSFEISKSVGDTNSVTPTTQKKREVMTQLDFSSMSYTCVEPVDASVKSALDTTVSSYLGDSSPGEVVSGVSKLDMDSELGNDGVSALNGKSSVNGFCETKLSDRSDVNYDTNETSPNDNGSHLILSSAQTNRGPADKSTYYIQESLTCNDVPIDQAASSSLGSECATSKLIPSHEEINVFLENIIAAVSSGTTAAARDAVINDDMKFKHEGVVSSSVSEEPGIRQTEIPCPSALRNEEKDGDLEVIVDIMEIDGSLEKDLHFTATNEQVISRDETAPSTIQSELQPADSGKHSSSSHMDMDMDPEYVYVKDKLPLVSNHFATDNGVSTTNSNDGGANSVPDTLSDIGIQETFSSVTDMHTLTCNPSVVNNFHEKVCGDDQQFDLTTVVASAETFFSETKTSLTLEHATEGNQPVSGKTVHLKLQDSKKTSHGPHLISAESALKNHLGLATQWIVPGRPFSAFTESQKTTSSTHVSKPRTWHRNANSSASSLPASVPSSSTFPPQRQLPQRNRSESNSYVRKGNTLVRKCVPAAVPQSSQVLSSSGYQLNSSGKDGLKKNAGSDSGAVIKKSLSLMRTVGINAPSDRASAPLPSGSKVSTSAAISSGNSTLSPVTEHNGLLETSSDPMNTSENKEREGLVKDSLGTPDSQENHTDPGNNQPDENLASSFVNKITYVKRKLNQLVASESVSDLSVPSADNNQPSEGYYKRRKHQLIRSSMESNGKQMVLLPTDDFKSGVQRARKVFPSRTFNNKRSLKAVARMIKKNSLVWTSSGTQSSNNNGSSFAHQKVLPHLFPWKRARHWRTVRQSQASSFNYTSPSTISKKLLLSRMRDTVYTRSTHGFSLRKYKVLSVDGSSLKWSKSIESRSKKVNEEATRAVAEVEKKKREHNGAACTSSGSKIRNNSPGKRIFRIGSVRYKMDPSRRTLKRISDDESTSSSVLNPEKDVKRSYVPRRLVIGNDEYVRIGNGNKLIRDPKKRTRILASERVRWSLHTARQRLAKKRKYCQFFTRFGKCNKDDGKCPYIHDPSKIAVCTKFLNGICSNSNCKLTHKVIPERMPDCSFFLQGLCTNKNCSYRHVNVNPKATTCEGFLKGYCADGNECRKKHSYVCQIFEETGACPQQATCKLHHPKKRTKGKIKKRSREHKNGWGRYFVLKDVCISEPVSVSARHCTRNGDDIFGNEFISIDVSDEEAGELNPPEQTTFYDSDPSELDLDDIDELIKPVGLLNKVKTNII